MPEFESSGPDDAGATKRFTPDDLRNRRVLAEGVAVFGRYVLKALVGRGGMGVVWRARDETLETDVALKFLPELVAHDPAAINDLKRETRRSLQLTHPNIVRIFDFVQDEHAAAIAMEYVDGSTLTQLRLGRPNQVFEPAELRIWVKQLCEALTYAHTKAKVVHRDLKPSNLMINAQGDLKVADFGIAATLADSTARVSTVAGSSGTLVYMSPQQMLGEKPAPTDDIYSLGATLYELLTSRPPFHSGRIELQVLQKLLPSVTQRRRELEISGEPVAPGWEEVIAACLAKDPQHRPQSAADVVSGLDLNAEKPSSALAPGTSAPTAVQPGDWKKEKPLAATSPGPGSSSDHPHPSRMPVTAVAGRESRGEGPPRAGSPRQDVALARDRKFHRLWAAAIIAICLLAGAAALARFGNPIYMPRKLQDLAVALKNPRAVPPAVPASWADLCWAWDTWLTDLQGNVPRLLGTEGLWSGPDDLQRRALVDFAASATYLRPESLVPAAAQEKRLGVLAKWPQPEVINALMDPEVSERVAGANIKIISLAQKFGEWPGWEVLRDLQQTLERRGFFEAAAGLKVRLPPKPSSGDHKHAVVRTMKLFNDVSLDARGTLMMVRGWREFVQLSQEMIVSGDRYQKAVAEMIFTSAEEGRRRGTVPSIGRFAEWIEDTEDGWMGVMRRYRQYFLDPDFDRQRMIDETKLQDAAKFLPTFPRSSDRGWEVELARFSTVPADIRDGLLTLKVSVLSITPSKRRGPEVGELLRYAGETGLLGYDRETGLSPEGRSKFADTSFALMMNWESFVKTLPAAEESDPTQQAKGFRQWLEARQSTDALSVLDYMKKLREVVGRIELLGLTKQEIENSKAEIYGSILKAGLKVEPEFMRVLVEK